MARGHNRVAILVVWAAGVTAGNVEIRERIDLEDATRTVLVEEIAFTAERTFVQHLEAVGDGTERIYAELEAYAGAGDVLVYARSWREVAP